MSELVLAIEKLVTPLLEMEQFELVDVTYQKGQGGWVLCIYIDKPGGISLDDCTHWSHKIGAVLDEKDVVPHAYSLEISSPGLNRPLKKLKDFEKFAGERISVKLYAPMDGQKNFHGILVGADEETIRLRQNGSDAEVVLPRPQVAKANLDPIVEI